MAERAVMEGDTAQEPVAAIVLAAGKSTRMRSKLPKPLHPVCGLPMTAHVVRACRLAGIQRVIVVVGHEAETVRAGLGEDVEYALQETQRGTGDAVKAAHSALSGWQGSVLILAGDVPLLTSQALTRLLSHHWKTHAAATLLTAVLEAPFGYGRILRNAEGQVQGIVEERDATDAQRAIQETNPSLYVFQAEALWSALAEVQPLNAQGEFYLTDTIELLVNRGQRVEAVAVEDARDVLGVNTRVELAKMNSLLRERLLRDLMLSGVSVTDPANTYIEVDVTVGQDTVIAPNSYLLRNTTIGEDCVIGPMTRISDSRIGNNVQILASQVVGSVLEEGVRVGPFANLRAGTHLGTKVKIGDFVEVKNATFAAGAQASHLAYIGDAEIGERTNIGAGTITCNYDGYSKHRTVIGSNAFIGSNSTLIAPVTIGDGAFIAAASSVPEDVPADALAIARPRPTIKEGWAAAYHAKKKKAKNENG